jgi:hypothetical protein
MADGERLARLLDDIDDPLLEAVSHLALALTAPIAGDLDKALAEASLSVEQLRSQDEPFWVAAALVTYGALEAIAGRYEDALGHLRGAARSPSGSTAPGSRRSCGPSWGSSPSCSAGSTTPGACSTRP